MGIDVSSRTICWTRGVMPAYRSESVLTLWKEAGVPVENNHSKFTRNRQTETDIAISRQHRMSDIQATLRLEGYTGLAHHQLD